MQKIRLNELIIPACVLIAVIVLYIIESKRDNRELELNNITLVAEIDSPGFFRHNNIFYGYMMDIIRDYAHYKNASIDIKIAYDCEELFDILQNGEADFGLTIAKHKNRDEHQARQVGFDYFDNYVVISKQKMEINSQEELVERMKGKRVAITNAVDDTHFFEKYSDPKYDINFYRDSTKFCRELSRMLAYNKVDFLICTKTTSALIKYIFKGFNIVFQIDNTNSSNFYVGHDSEKLYNDFSRWYFNRYVNSPAEAYNKNLYGTTRYIRDFIENGYLVSYHQASPFDYIFKKIGKDIDIDWRVLCSIAHFESRFNRTLISNRGARGIMQIMPHVAKSYGFKVDSLRDISYNIYVGGIILADIRKMLSYEDKEIDDDKMSIILACYNGGFGHINDARRVARSMGKDINSWKDIRSALLLLNSPKIYENNKLVKSGKFRAHQTIGYVESVMGRYNELKREL